MELIVLKKLFSICKVKDLNKINLNTPFLFIAKTDEENSLVCLTENIPDGTTEINSNWRAFRIKGILDFSLIGIISKISSLLAENKISVFAVSTFNTDYIFTKDYQLNNALSILEKNGFKIHFL